MPLNHHNTIAHIKVADERAAEVSIRIGSHVTFDARISNAGLLSVGALVSGILLSTAVVVLAAGRKGRRKLLATHSVGDGG